MNSWKKYISEISLSQKDRSVGFLFFVIGTVISILKYKQTNDLNSFVEHHYLLISFSVLILLMALVIPRMLRPLTVVWFFFGWILNLVFSPIIMGVLYYIIVTPFGLGRKFFVILNGNKNLGNESDSSWIKRQPEGPHPDSLKMQF